MKGISRIICLAVVLAIVSFSFVSAAMVNVDVKPKRCPNTLMVASLGNIPVAILGTETFDVNDVDPASVLLAGVAPLNVGREDVAGPVVPGEDCACTADSADGFVDLDMRFSVGALVAALETQLGRDLVKGDVLVLNLTAMTYDGTPIEGSDCVTVNAGEVYRNIPNIDK